MGRCEGGLWTGGAGTNSNDAGRAAISTPVVPRTRYGTYGRGSRTLLSAPGSGRRRPDGGCWSFVRAVHPAGPLRFGARSPPSHPGPAARPWSVPLILLVLSLLVSGSRRQVVHGPTQLRQIDAYHFLAASCHWSFACRMASLWPAASSLSRPRSQKGHL